MSLFATLIHSFGSWFALPSRDDELPEPTTPTVSGYLQGAIGRSEALEPTDEQIIVARQPLPFSSDVCFSDGRVGNWILVDENAVIDVRSHQ